MQLNYLDLYLIHQLFGDIYGSWYAMEKLYQERKIRTIGLSNFEPDHVMDLIIHTTVAPTVNQIEIILSTQIEAKSFLEENHKQTESWYLFLKDVIIYSVMKY